MQLDSLSVCLSVGSIPLIEQEGGNVMTMRTDTDDHLLLLGDTSGSIAVFDIQQYCVDPLQV